MPLTLEQARAVARRRTKHEQHMARIREAARNNPENYACIYITVEQLVDVDGNDPRFRALLESQPNDILQGMFSITLAALEGISLSILETSDADAHTP